MKTRMTTVAIILLSLLNSINADNTIRWALSNLPDGYVYHDFHSGYAVCQDITSKKYGAIDTNGDIAIPVVYDYMGDFNGDATNVKTIEGEGIIGSSNKYLLPPNSHYTIIPITTEDSRKQTLKNCFLVTNTSNSTQAIFYKDRFITGFTPIHSLSYDVQFPFIQMDNDYIINTELEDTLSYYLNMGCYYLTFHENSISAISFYTGKDITPFVIGEDINIADALEYDNQLTLKMGGETESISIEDYEKLKRQNENSTYIYSIKRDNGAWNITNHSGKVKYSLKDEDGWICKFPIFQNGIVWFERNIPNSKSTEIKVYTIGGLEIFNKTIEGSFSIKSFPSHMNMLGSTLCLHNVPYVIISEISPEGIDTQINLCHILNYKKITTFDGSNTKNYNIYSDYMCYQDSNSNCFVFDIAKHKNMAFSEFVGFWENAIVAKDNKGQYVLFSNGKMTKIKNYNEIRDFNDDVAIAIANGYKAVIDIQGEKLLQDGNDIEIVGMQSSENVILARDKNSNKYGYIYNPLVKDTLIYNTGYKKEQLYVQGLDYYNKKKYNKAKDCFAALCRHEPDNDDYLVKYADCLTAQKYYNAAINKYNKALKLNPTNQEATQHLAIAQSKRERAEEIRSTVYGIASAVNDALGSTAQALNVSTLSSYNETASNSSKNNSQNSSNSDRNNSTYWWSLKNSYFNYENQLSKMKTYPETYNDSDRKYIQSKMKEIRNKLQKSGYTLNKSQWEDWNGK